MRHNVLTSFSGDIELYIPFESGEQTLSNGPRSLIHRDLDNIHVFLCFNSMINVNEF